MTDYKNLKLIATSNPHIRGSETTRSIMLDVIIAMCPALIWAIIYFGVEALLLTAVSVIGCVVFEGLYRKLMHKPQSIDDLSAVVTGMLLAFVCPATTPLWMILIGDFFAIIVVKQLFGGIGKNFLNPALAGRAALLASYAGAMTTWLPAGTKAAIGGGMPVDVVSAATPLAYLKTGDLEGLKQIASVGDMFLGKVGGSMGEVSALMLLIGGLYLIWRKVINWQTPVAYIATVAVLTVLFPKAGGAEYMLYSIFGGGLFLGWNTKTNISGAVNISGNVDADGLPNNMYLRKDPDFVVETPAPAPAEGAELDELQEYLTSALKEYADTLVKTDIVDRMDPDNMLESLQMLELASADEKLTDDEIAERFTKFYSGLYAVPTTNNLPGIITKNSDYFKKARKYGHFTGYKN